MTTPSMRKIWISLGENTARSCALEKAVLACFTFSDSAPVLPLSTRSVSDRPAELVAAACAQSDSESFMARSASPMARAASQ